MESTCDIFSDNNNEISTSEIILEKIKKGEWNEILHGLCSMKENTIRLNYIYFKYLAKNETYSYILNYIIYIIDLVLINNKEFIVHVNMKNLTIVDIDKHKGFIQQISGCLKEKYPQKLTKCYIYNAPFVFSQIYNIVSIFIDKDTQKKIELVNK